MAALPTGHASNAHGVARRCPSGPARCSGRCDWIAGWRARVTQPPSRARHHRTVSVPPRNRSLKRSLSKPLTSKVVNRLVRPVLERGFMSRTHALLETKGRRSGLPRRVPVGNGLRGETFWIVSEHGYGSDYVKNIQADARVRVKVGRRWRAGTAHLLPDDDVTERMRMLRRGVNDASVRLMGSQLMTIRIDLDS